MTGNKKASSSASNGKQKGGKASSSRVMGRSNVSNVPASSHRGKGVVTRETQSTSKTLFEQYSAKFSKSEVAFGFKQEFKYTTIKQEATYTTKTKNTRKSSSGSKIIN